MNLITELRRRKVFRVAAAYAVVAWGVAQIADLVLANTAAPPWVMQVILLMLALGFPIAVVLAWAFEVTPAGVKRTEAASDSQRAAGLPVSEYAFIGLMLTVIVVAGYQVSTLHDRNGAVDETARVAEPEAPLENAPETSQEPDDGSHATSIAVLAFENMSMDAGNEYFADGISEELLNILAGIDGLKVASRTSAFSFKGSSTPIPEIAEQLDVRHVLEGSVRKAGNRVRITAQLIDATEDAHLWSEVYDRELDDIFAVQEEIARAITGELESVLGTRSVDVTAPTRDMDAYELYLRGRSRFFGRIELNEAVEDLRAAVEQDDDFAEAWAFLAALYWLHGNGAYQSDYDRDEMTRLAGLASARASELDAEIPIALAVQGQIAADSGRPGAVADGVRLLQRAVAMPAPDTTPRLWLALLWMELGHPERAEPLLVEAREMDPLVGINSGALAVSLAAQGEISRAEPLALVAAGIDGLSFWGDLLVVNRFHAHGPERAADLLGGLIDRLRTRDRDERSIRETAEDESILAAIHDPSLRADLLSEWQDYGDADIASLLFDRATLALESAPYDSNRPWAIAMGAWLPAMEWLREDPRYFELMERRGRVAYWESHGYPRGCRPVDGPAGRHLECPEAER
ncbi:hypothetical protein [Halomonas denitrificans]|nr:hypothetical protein [Halomonas denitrificans]